MKKNPLKWRFLNKTMLFIDVSNIYYSQKTLGWQIDYQKLIKYFKKETKLIAAYFYSGVVSKNKEQKKFFETMKNFGFIVRTKEVKWIRNKDGKILKGKGNLDIELTLDMSQNIKSYDTAILFSGDSDFSPLVEFVIKKERKVIVFSARGHIAKELARVATKYIPFESMKEDLERVDKKSPRISAGEV